VWGKDDKVDGFGVGAANFPANPNRTTETTPMFFLGWKDADGNGLTASTPISKDTTVTAQWTDEEPEGWMELIVTGGTQAPVYGFEVPTGEKLGDYTKLTVKIKAAGTAFGSGLTTARFRAFGPFLPTGWSTSGLSGTVTTAQSSQSMGNANNQLLLTFAAAAGAPINGITLPADNKWYEFTIDLKAGRHATYNGGTENSGWTLYDDAEGIQLLGITLVAQGGNNESRSFYIKDIKLSNGLTGAALKEIEALDPKDDKLFGGTGAGIYVRGVGTIDATRIPIPFVFNLYMIIRFMSVHFIYVIYTCIHETNSINYYSGSVNPCYVDSIFHVP